jgi:CRISPR-associated protein Csm1
VGGVEMESNEKEYQNVILAALLHDMVKIPLKEDDQYFAKHAGSSENFKRSLSSFFDDKDAKEIANLIEKYYKAPSTRDEQILHIADKLASTERPETGGPRFKCNGGSLVAVTSRVKFRSECGQEKFYKLDTLQVKEGILFPANEPLVEKGTYGIIWERFANKVKSLGKYQPTDFATLFYILKEFGSLIPSATPWEEDEYNRVISDISIFDHSKATCAIAACLKQFSEEELSNDDLSQMVSILQPHNEKEDVSQEMEILRSSGVTDKKLFVLLRADVAGIQKFIYSITKAETKGTSKKLRGRSYYVSILTDVISDWIIRNTHLPVTNILFCGGGRFDILLPRCNEVTARLKNLRNDLEDWLLKKFFGDLSIQIITVDLSPRDFFDFGKVYRDAEDKLIEAKRRKFEGMIERDGFFKSAERVEDLCNSCLLTPVKKGEECELCRSQREIIGSNLPRTDFISFVYGEHKTSDKQKISYDRFGLTVFLQDKSGVDQLLANNREPEIVIYRLNPKFKENDGLDFLNDNLGKKPVSFGYKFLGNSAPLALKDCQILPPPKEPIKEGEVLDFEEIAALSQGAKYLGILKMDVDYLGLLFSLGIEQASISRISTLSGNFELFFNAWLNEICEEITKKWNESLLDDDPKKGLVNRLFYIVYSGGDDLFIIGPWDKIIELAGDIYKDFRKYTCQNTNITISGGILLVKPQFPIHRFSQLVTEELDKSKHDADTKSDSGVKEKNRITLFGETVEWVNGDSSFEELVKFSKQLCAYVEDREKPLAKGFIYFLGKLERYFYRRGSLMWIPNLFYSLGRRVKKEEVKKELASKIRPSVMEKMRIPVSYVSLRTRKG